MMRLLATLGAFALCLVPLATLPVRPVAAGAGAALLLSLAGVVTLRRWPATAGACLAVANYALALWLASAPLGVLPAMGFGLALLLLLQPLEIARCRRRATDVGVTRSQLAGWVVFGLVAPGVVMLALGLSQVIAGSVPLLAAPLLAAAGALGVLLGLASALTRSSARPDREERA